MNAPTATPDFLLNFVAALRAFSDEGYIMRTVRAGGVEAGDYLVSYLCEHPGPQSTTRVRNVKVERVLATGGEQSSGPSKSRQTIALEGNPKIQQYTDNPDVLILRKTEVL